MRLLSINVGLPREVDWRGRAVRTSIFKSPTSGRLRVTKLNVEGDQQSDLSVHGGIEKAVYVYPSEHYAFWREELPGMDLPWGRSARTSRRRRCWKAPLASGIRLERCARRSHRPRRVGPPRARHYGLRADVDQTEAHNTTDD